MEFGGVNVHALDSGENTVCFFGISNAFYEHLHVKMQYYTRKYTVSTALSLRKMP